MLGQQIGVVRKNSVRTKTNVQQGLVEPAILNAHGRVTLFRRSATLLSDRSAGPARRWPARCVDGPFPQCPIG